MSKQKSLLENTILLSTQPTYCYYRKDHLGNNREVWQAPHVLKNETTVAASTIQRTQYYPSGLPFGSLTGDNPERQPYKYNGKEFVTMHGFDIYDYGMRGYYAAIMRFTTPDPLAEKYYSVSPYAYCGNNPVNAIDLRGDSITFIADNKDLINQTTTLINEVVGLSVAKVDKNGVLSVSNLSDKQLSKLTQEQQAFYSTMKDAATSDGMTKIGIVSGSESVFVGSYYLEQIDVTFGTGEGGNMFSSFGHEVVEQQKKQIEGKTYSSAHTIYALSAEDNISGYTRGSSYQSGVSYIDGKMNGTLIVFLLIVKIECHFT